MKKIFINKINILLVISIVVASSDIFATEKYHPIKLLTVSTRLAKEAESCKLLLYIYKSNNPNEFISCYKFNSDISKFINVGKYNIGIETFVIGLNETQIETYIKNKKMINYVYFKIIKIR